MNPGNYGRHGSSPAEANHGSYIQMIGPVSVDDPEQEIRKMLDRHAEICRQRKTEIARYHLDCVSTESSHMVQNNNTGNMEALINLSSWGYELWKSEKDQS